MRQKIESHLQVPDNDIEGYIPYYSIQDDVENNDQTRFCVIFSTKRLISLLSKSEVLHIDATYRLNWQGYPVMIVGVSSATGKFFGSMSVLSSHEDSEAWSEIYRYIHSLNVHPKYRMADGAQSIMKAGIETFGDCEHCQGSERLMCWSHVHRAIVPQLKHLSNLDKNVGKSLLTDIEEIQWLQNDDKSEEDLTSSSAGGKNVKVAEQASFDCELCDFMSNRKSGLARAITYVCAWRRI